MIRLRISKGGSVHGLWTDDIPFCELGVVHVQRASHVEFDDRTQAWCVRHAAPRTWLVRILCKLSGWPKGPVLHMAASRSDALAWEHEHFQPGGPGWRRAR